MKKLLVILCVVGIVFCFSLTWANADNAYPDRQEIYSKRLLIGMNPGENGVIATDIKVPEGKRLIIEHVSMQGDVQAGQVILMVEVGAHFNSDKALDIVPVYLGRSSDGVRDWFSASQPVKLRLEAGETVWVCAMRDKWDGNAGIRINLFGYLINYP